MPEEVKEVKKQEPITFVTNFDTLTIFIRPTRKIVVNDEVIEKEGKRIEFARGTFTTSDKEEIEFLREYLKEKKDGTVITEIKK